MSASKLIRPAIEFKDGYLDAMKEYHGEGHYTFNDIEVLQEDFETYVKHLKSEQGHPHQPFQEWVEPVPETVAWMVKDEHYIGSVNIRHRLNWHLEKWGGHIHFIIRPSMRGMGFGKKILLKAMPIANYLGIETALLTVAPDNEPARHIIESCGGEFEDELPETDQFPVRQRYWLDCT